MRQHTGACNAAWSSCSVFFLWSLLLIRNFTPGLGADPDPVNDVCDEQGDECEALDARSDGEAAERSSSLMQVAGFVDRETTPIAILPTFHKPSGVPVDKVWSWEAPLLNISCMKPFSAIGVPVHSRCPAMCPFFAQDKVGNHPCMYQCLTAEQCGSLDETHYVVDQEGFRCIGCALYGCELCRVDGKVCEVCKQGYVYNDGKCRWSPPWWLIALVIVAALVLILCIIWYLVLLCRPTVNEHGLQYALSHRSHSLVQKFNHDSPHHPRRRHDGDTAVSRELWPLNANLLNEDVAGNGTILFFRFQVFLIVIGFIICVAWSLYAYYIEPRLFLLGIRSFDGSHELCELVAWGHETREETMPAFLRFLGGLYVFMFAACIGFALSSRRFISDSDENTTMKDFAAVLTGLPKALGRIPNVEDLLTQNIKEITGQDVVGTSVCWNYIHDEDKVNEWIMGNMVERYMEHHGPIQKEDCPVEKETFWKRVHDKVTFLVAGVQSGHDPEALSAKRKEELARWLETVACTGTAYVVFHTEASREAAVVYSEKRKGFPMPALGAEVKLSRAVVEPEAMLWKNHAIRRSEVPGRLRIGILKVLGFLIAWGCLYGAASYYVMSQMGNGEIVTRRSTGLCILMLLVAIGTAFMNSFCRAASEEGGFLDKTNEEAMYVVMFAVLSTFSLMLDLMIDFICVISFARSSEMVDYDAKPLQNMDLYAISETYPFQKVLGVHLFLFAFPSCFMMPYIMEVVKDAARLHVASAWLRGTRGVAGIAATTAVAPLPINFGRYADLLLNLSLVCIMLWLPSGFLLPIIAAFVISNVFIYLSDRQRILRRVEMFCFDSEAVDVTVCYMLALPTAAIAAAIVYKLHYLPQYRDVLSGWLLPGLQCAVFVGHIALHWALLRYFVPAIAKKLSNGNTSMSAASPKRYSKEAESFPCTWFSANPVHCMRSDLVSKHKPPCGYHIVGHQCLLRKNAECGNYFDGRLHW